MCDFALVPGESMFFQLFLGVLTCSDVFSDLLESFVVPCTCARGPTASIWLLSLKSSPACGSHPREVSSALLTLLTCFQVYLNRSQRSACVYACLACLFIYGKFGITDGFAGLLELLTWPGHVCRHSTCLGSWGPSFQFIQPLLVVPTISPSSPRTPSTPTTTSLPSTLITAKYSYCSADVIVADGQFVVTPTTKPFKFQIAHKVGKTGYVSLFGFVTCVPD